MTLLVAPLLGIVQTIAAHVGLVARNDLQTLTRQRYGRKVAAILLVSIVVVNVVTIAADLQAGATGIGILAGVDTRWLVLPLGLALVGLLLVGKYDEVLGVLRYLMVGFLTFGAVAFLAHPDWPLVLRNSLIPTLSLNRDVIAGALALIGTTLTSYVYVWETVERGVEEVPDETSTSMGLTRAAPRRRRRRVHGRGLLVHARRIGSHARTESPDGDIGPGGSPGAAAARRLWSG